MDKMTDARAVEVLAAMREDGGVVADADYTAAIDRAVARLREPVGVPVGWVLVPREPTEAMIEAGNAAAHAGGCDLWQLKREVMNAWPAMLAAAPQPPAEAQAQGGGEVVAWRVTPEGLRWYTSGTSANPAAPNHQSAPVGVEGKSRELLASERKLAASIVNMNIALAAIESALAQQSAPSAPVGMKAYPLWQAIHAAAEKAGFPCNVGLSQVVDALNSLTQQPAAVDVFDLDCPHSAIGGCDLCAAQPGGSCHE